MLAMADVVRILEDWFTFWGKKPLAVIPNSSFLFLFFGAVLSGVGAFLLMIGSTDARTKQIIALSNTGPGELPKTYHADRWWMRDRSGSVLIWDEQAQAWSPWVPDTDPGLPPGWS